MSQSKSKKIKMLYCKNQSCKKFLCRTDGEVLFVENLEVVPKIAAQRIRGAEIVKRLVCENCRQLTSIALKVLPEPIPKQKTAGRKFLIFRSRFD